MLSKADFDARRAGALADYLPAPRDRVLPKSGPAEPFAEAFERGSPLYLQTIGGSAPDLQWEAGPAVNRLKLILSSVLVLVLLGGLVSGARPTSEPHAA